MHVHKTMFFKPLATLIHVTVTLSMTTHRITFGVMQCSIKGEFATLSITIFCYNAKCHYDDCRVLFVTVLNIIIF
jgi:hypothetical protein